MEDEGSFMRRANNDEFGSLHFPEEAVCSWLASALTPKERFLKGIFGAY